MIDRDVDAEARRLNEELKEMERKQKQELKEYRKNRKKVWYLN